MWRKFSQTCTVLGLGIVSSSVLANETFSSAPGTRANAMGGAYLGVARDATSIWYNPAGMSNIAGSSFLIEAGDMPEFNRAAFDATQRTEQIDTSQELKYVGYATGGDGSGWGVAYFKPYIGVRSGLEAPTGFDTQQIQVYSEVEVEQVSIAYARKFGAFSLGGSLDVQQISINAESATASSAEETTGVGWVLGAIYEREIGEQGSLLTLGAVYRDSTTEADTDLNNTPLSASTPQTFGVGGSYEWLINPRHSLLMAVSYEEATYKDSGELVHKQCNDVSFYQDFGPNPGEGFNTIFGLPAGSVDGPDFVASLGDPSLTQSSDWNDWCASSFTNDAAEDVFATEGLTLDTTYDKTAYGLEYSFLTQGNNALYLRLGYNEIGSDDDLVSWFESEGTSAGIGIRFGSFNIDLAVENREIFTDRTRSRFNWLNDPNGLTYDEIRDLSNEIDLYTLSFEWSLGSN